MNETKITLQSIQIKSDETLKECVTLVQSVQQTEETRAELSTRLEQMEEVHAAVNASYEKLNVHSKQIEEERIQLIQKIEEVRKILLMSI